MNITSLTTLINHYYVHNSDSSMFNMPVCDAILIIVWLNHATYGAVCKDLSLDIRPLACLNILSYYCYVADLRRHFC